MIATVLGIGASMFFLTRNSGPAGPTPTAETLEKEDELAFVRPPAETFEPVFEPCAHCHQVGDGARHTSGPHLNAIIDSRAAARDYPYSAPMQDSGLVWDEATLTDFLVDPHRVVPGTRMLLEGLSRAEAGQIVDYLKSLDEDSASTPDATSET